MTVQSDLDLFNRTIEEKYLQTLSGEKPEKMRQTGWSRFLTLGLPTKKNELYRYVKLSKLYKERLNESTTTSSDLFSIPNLDSCCQSCLVFINGVYSEKHSKLGALKDKVTLLSLKDAKKTFGSFIDQQSKQSITIEPDPFAALNLALHDSGIWIYVHPHVSLTDPIHILSIVDGSKSYFVMPRIQGLIGKGANCSFQFSHDHTTETAQFFNFFADIVLEENATLKIVSDSMNLSEIAQHFEAWRFQLKKESSLDCFTLTRGTELFRADHRISLIGEGARATIKGLGFLTGKRVAHTSIFMEHVSPNCQSNQLFKNVLDDFAHASFTGKIYVQKEAQKTDAFQLNQNLLLSDYSRAECRPNLEIFADDVKASHGSTTGGVDEEQLFYLKSRGFSHSEANQLLVKGFCQDLLLEIPTSFLNPILKKTENTDFGLFLEER